MGKMHEFPQAMNSLVLACEVLKPEMELVARKMPDSPEIIYLSQRLHDFPEKLREGVQEKLDEIESSRADIDLVIMGYGLCGRGLAGVTSKRVTLLYPRLHDCIPLLLGYDQKNGNISTREGTTYWSSPGWLDSFLSEYHLTDMRFRKYSEKFGEKRARKMVEAEDALLNTYKELCHVQWPGLPGKYIETARKVAEATGLQFAQRSGKSDYIRKLLSASRDPERFLEVLPGQSIDMDPDGSIIITEAGYAH